MQSVHQRNIVGQHVITENEMTEEIKESRMTVYMTKEALYDFLLFHAYSKFSGFLVNILGLAIIFLGIFSYTTGKVNGIGGSTLSGCGSIVPRSYAISA